MTKTFQISDWYSSFLQFWSAPIFPDDEAKTRTAANLYFLCKISIVGIIVLAILYSFTDMQANALLATILSIIPSLGWMFLADRGYVRLAAQLFVFTSWVALMMSAIDTGGIQAIGYVGGGILSVLLAGLLLQRFQIFVVFILTVLFGYLQLWLEVNNLLPPARISDTATTKLTAYILFLFIGSGLAYITVRSIQNALDDAQRQLKELEKTEAALRESESRYRMLAENLPNSAALVFDHDLRFLLVDGPELEQTGYQKSAMEGKTLDEALPAEYAKLFETNMRAVLNGEHFTAELPFDDQLYLYNYIPLKDEQGRIHSGLILAQNVTAWRQAEFALRASEERYRIISELISDYAFAYDIHPDGTFTPAWITEGSFSRLTGYPWDEIGATFTLYHPDDAEMAQRHVEQTIQGQAQSGEYRIVTRDGDVRWLSIRRRLAFDPVSRQPIRFYGAAQDITEQKLAQEEVLSLNAELEESATQLGMLNEIANDISSLSDLNSTLKRVLRKLQSALPLDVFFVALRNEEDDNLIYPVMYDRERFWVQPTEPLRKSSLVAQVLHTGEPILENRSSLDIQQAQQTNIRIGDVNRVSASLIFAPLSLAGETIGVLSIQSYSPNSYGAKHMELLVGAAYQIAIAVDNARLYESLQSELATRQQAEQAIRQLNIQLERRVEERTAQLKLVNKELEAFAYSISHDLRAPLRTIDGFSRMVMETNHARLDESGQAYLNRIRAATQRMGDMVAALLTLSRVTRYELVIETVDLSEEAEGIMATLRETEPDRQVVVRIQTGLTATGDRRLLCMMLENLLGNAWKYSSKKPESVIEFGAETHDDRTVFFVRDNGAGFDAAFADKLFTVFQRLHSETEFAGTGVGLATVQRIIKRHNGTIWAESQVGEGATFYFTLQVSNAQDGELNEP